MLLLSISKVSTYILNIFNIEYFQETILEEKIEAYVQRMKLVSVIHILFLKKAYRVPSEEKLRVGNVLLCLHII